RDGRLVRPPDRGAGANRPRGWRRRRPPAVGVRPVMSIHSTPAPPTSRLGVDSRVHLDPAPIRVGWPQPRASFDDLFGPSSGWQIRGVVFGSERNGFWGEGTLCVPGPGFRGFRPTPPKKGLVLAPPRASASRNSRASQRSRSATHPQGGVGGGVRGVL